MYSNCPETRLMNILIFRSVFSMCERKKEINFKKESRKERKREKRQRKKTERKKKKRRNERMNGRMDKCTYERKYAGSTFRRKLFYCLSKYSAKVLVIVVVKA